MLLEVESPGRQGDDVLTGLFAGHPAFPEGYNPGGIWRPVRILSSGPAYIDHWHLRTVELNGDEATLALTAQIYAVRATEVTVELQLPPIIS